jgi:hypothetical protein
VATVLRQIIFGQSNCAFGRVLRALLLMIATCHFSMPPGDLNEARLRRT